MRTLMISYDLGVPETSQDYKKIIDYIKKFGTWAKVLKSQWLVVSDKSVSSVRDDLNSLTDNNDKILIIDITGDAWATTRIEGEITDWMKRNM